MGRYDPLVTAMIMPILALDTSLLKPGLRVAVGLSGGADSVALLRALAARSTELGLVVHAAHLHHGLRGEEADADRDFCREVAQALGVPFHESRVDTAAEAKSDPARVKAAETIEEAARRLRYAWFRELMASGEVDAVTTAHTRDDQAETVLAKFLRGAWTEGLSGIHPVVHFPEGRVLRPLLATGRTEIEAYLQALGQGWRDDSSNRHLTFTRNRIRHQLLPLLEEWNPQLREHLAKMAELAREEETWWEAEVARVTAQIILPGRPVRGGGRAAGEGAAIEVARLAELPVALQRRVLRQAAERLGSAPDFDATEALRNLALAGRAGQKCELAGGLRGERTHRELRLTRSETGNSAGAHTAPVLTIRVPGDFVSPEWGIRVRISVSASDPASTNQANAEIAAGAEALFEDESVAARLKSCPVPEHETIGRAVLRPWKPGDRVRLRHSGGPRKVKEVLERMRVTGSARADWPVLELHGRIVWMQGVQLEPEPGMEVTVTALDEAGPGRPKEINPAPG